MKAQTSCLIEFPRTYASEGSGATRDDRGSSAVPVLCWPAAPGHPSAAGRNAGTPDPHSSPASRPPAERPASIHPPSLDQLRASLGTDAEPIDPSRRRNRSIGLNGNLEFPRVQRIDQRPIQLQQRFASGADHKLLSRRRARPASSPRSAPPTPPRARIFRHPGRPAGKIRIAELAHRLLRGPARVPTRDCIPRTGRRRPRAPSARPRLAACRRSL